MKNNKQENKKPAFFMLFILIVVIICLTFIGKVYLPEREKRIKLENKIKKDNVTLINKKINNRFLSKNYNLKKNIVLKDFSNLPQNDKEKLKKIILNWIYSRYNKAYKNLINQILTYILNNSKFSLLLISLIATESSFDAQSVSNMKAYGLCQIRYDIWKKEAPDELKKIGITSVNEMFDPIKNIKLAEYILFKYYKECNYNIEKALIKYNTGKNSYKKIKNYKTLQKVKKYVNNIFLTCGKLYTYIMLYYNKGE